jgi:hypothetical protein
LTPRLAKAACEFHDPAARGRRNKSKRMTLKEFKQLLKVREEEVEERHIHKTTKKSTRNDHGHCMFQQ